MVTGGGDLGPVAKDMIIELNCKSAEELIRGLIEFKPAERMIVSVHCLIRVVVCFASCPPCPPPPSFRPFCIVTFVSQNEFAEISPLRVRSQINQLAVSLVGLRFCCKFCGCSLNVRFTDKRMPKEDSFGGGHNSV